MTNVKTMADFAVKAEKDVDYKVCFEFGVLILRNPVKIEKGNSIICEQVFPGNKCVNVSFFSDTTINGVR
jgi:hypothetical protein